MSSSSLSSDRLCKGVRVHKVSSSSSYFAIFSTSIMQPTHEPSVPTMGKATAAVIVISGVCSLCHEMLKKPAKNMTINNTVTANQHSKANTTSHRVQSAVRVGLRRDTIEGVALARRKCKFALQRARVWLCQYTYCPLVSRRSAGSGFCLAVRAGSFVTSQVTFSTHALSVEALKLSATGGGALAGPIHYRAALLLHSECVEGYMRRVGTRQRRRLSAVRHTAVCFEH